MIEVAQLDRHMNRKGLEVYRSVQASGAQWYLLTFVTWSEHIIILSTLPIQKYDFAVCSPMTKKWIIVHRLKPAGVLGIEGWTLIKLVGKCNVVKGLTLGLSCDSLMPSNCDPFISPLVSSSGHQPQGWHSNRGLRRWVGHGPIGVLLEQQHYLGLEWAQPGSWWYQGKIP